MAETKETVILDFQVQEADAISSLERTKKSIVELKKEQADLNKAYKEGAVSLDQYAKESVQLEASLKKQQASYNTIQRTVTGLKNPFDKLNESIKEQAKQVTVAGVSLSSFANPATATVAVLGGLFAAYSKSSIGAKDLQFASNQLSAATVLLTNDLARLVSTAEDGEGFLTKTFNFLLESMGPTGSALAIASKGAAMAIEELDDLRREGLKVQAQNNERLQENAEIMTKLADSTVSYNEKLKLTNQAYTNIILNRDDALKIAEKELDVIRQQAKGHEGDEKFLDAIELKELEISKIRKDSERAVSRIEKAKSNIVDATNKEADAENKLNEAQASADEDAKYQRLKRIDDERVAGELQLEQDAATHEEFVQGINDRMVSIAITSMNKQKKINEDYLKNVRKVKKEEVQIDFLAQQQKLSNASYVIGQVAGLVDRESAAYKVLAITQATIDTYRAASAALAPPPIGAGPLFGPILAATTIALGLANVAKIMDMGAAAGGGSFYTKGPQLLMVGDNPGGVERVDVTPVSGKGKTVVGKNMIAMAGGGSITTGKQEVWMPFGMQSGVYYEPALQYKEQGWKDYMDSIRVELAYSEFKTFERGVHFKEKIATA